MLNLVGYWVIENAPENVPEGGWDVCLNFSDDGLLQWGYENEWRTCVISFKYWIESDNIGTICPPHPRKELTPFSIALNGKLQLAYSNYETTWGKTDKKAFFEGRNVGDPGAAYEGRIDYIALLKSPPYDFQIQRAALLGISPQILVNTKALWECWEYSLYCFASFHLDDFEFIIDKGVLIDDDDNMDRTLLSHLAEDGNANAVKLLLERGSNINGVDISGNTALDHAIWNNRTEVMGLLRERGARLGSELD